MYRRTLKKKALVLMLTAALFAGSAIPAAADTTSVSTGSVNAASDAAAELSGDTASSADSTSETAVADSQAASYGDNTDSTSVSAADAAGGTVTDSTPAAADSTSDAGTSAASSVDASAETADGSDASVSSADLAAEAEAQAAADGETAGNVFVEETEEAVVGSTYFTDVSPTSYYFNAVRWAVDKGYTTGTSATKFSPDAEGKRVFLAFEIWAYAGKPSCSAACPFTDISDLFPEMQTAIRWCYSKGYFVGTSASTFSPEETVTRGAMINAFWKYAGEKTGGSVSFKDVYSANYYYKAVSWGVAAGIVAGVTSTSFAPNANCTRAQILTCLYNLAGCPYGTNIQLTGLSAANTKVLINCIGAVETGGMVYGKRDYSCYCPPYKNTSSEVTCTLGWSGFYGYNAKKLIQMIYDKDPEVFQKIDAKGIIKARLAQDWVATKWKPNDTEKQLLVSLISSSIGMRCQDELFAEIVQPVVTYCRNTYTKDTKAVIMYAEISILGNQGPARRIFDRCNGNYSLSNILASLKLDQSDTSSINQVGDDIFWSRHTTIVGFLNKYVV
jgi:hypothetical protein